MEIEPYLKHVMKNKDRRAMTAMRISAHRLEIERGRYASKKEGAIVREKRFCTLCEKRGVKAVGDEAHAIMVCPTFESERNEIFRNIADIHPFFTGLGNFDKMVFILRCEGKCASYAAKFLNTILSTSRPQILPV